MSVSLELALRFLSFTYCPLKQGTGLTCSFVVTYNNWSNNPTAFAFPQQAEQMTTCARVIQYAHCTQKKTSEKKNSHPVQNFFFSFWRAQSRMEVSGDFLRFFFPLFFIAAACHPLCVAMLSHWGRLGHLLALWPAALERGGGPCGDGRACNMFRRVCLETGGLGQSAAREEDRAKHSWQTHTPTRSHSHTATRLLYSLHKRFSFSPSFPPLFHFFPPCRGLKSQLNLDVL